jgi:hypothetical protein
MSAEITDEFICMSTWGCGRNSSGSWVSQYQRPLTSELISNTVVDFPYDRCERRRDDKPAFAREITVIYTSTETAPAALTRAGELADRLGASVLILAVQSVPYTVPLDTPPIPFKFSHRQLCRLAEESSVETEVKAYVCRDEWETLNKVLNPRSLVVIGTVKRWWPTREEKLARKLRRAGHDVIVAEA